MNKNQKIFISAIVILVVLVMLPNGPKQTIAPGCFTNADCRVPVQKGYCDVDYACVAGHCTSVQVLCPERCDGGEDEDMDGLIDCEDPDCFNDNDCPCEKASYNRCMGRQCYCPLGKVPVWIVSEEDNYCRCR